VSDLVKSQPTARCLSSGRVGLYVSGNAALESYNLHVTRMVPRLMTLPSSLTLLPSRCHKQANRATFSRNQPRRVEMCRPRESSPQTRVFASSASFRYLRCRVLIRFDVDEVAELIAASPTGFKAGEMSSSLARELWGSTTLRSRGDGREIAETDETSKNAQKVHLARDFFSRDDWNHIPPAGVPRAEIPS
jgi:hypothetical protein